MAEQLEKYVVDPGTGCYLWYGAMFRNGYGNVRSLGRNYLRRGTRWWLAYGRDTLGRNGGLK